MLIDFGDSVVFGAGDAEDFAHLYLVGKEWVVTTAHDAPEGATWVGGVMGEDGNALTLGEARDEFA